MGIAQADTTTGVFYAHIQRELDAIKEAGLYKAERIIILPQNAMVRTVNGKEVISLYANNYLGLSPHPRVLKAVHEALDSHGFSLSSVCFVYDTRDLCETPEARLAKFLGTEDTILYGSALDTNDGLFETPLDTENTIISDKLSHASIIDGIYLYKAQRYRYKHSDLDDLHVQLQAANTADVRFKLMFTGGVFSMDGIIARLDEIRTTCDKFGALLGIDKCRVTDFLGERGRRSHEHHSIFSGIDIITGTLGRDLNGVSGGFTSARKEMVVLLRQRSRPYPFSNTVAPCIVGATAKMLGLLEADIALCDKLEDSALYFRRKTVELSFDVKPGDHPIIPITVYDTQKVQALSKHLSELGVYVAGFFYPVVPKRQARVYVQTSAMHECVQLDMAFKTFETVGRELGVI